MTQVPRAQEEQKEPRVQTPILQIRIVSPREIQVTYLPRPPSEIEAEPAWASSLHPRLPGSMHSPW